MAEEAYKDRTASDHDFNLNLLFCIPKKAAFNDEELGEVFEAEGTRPISVADFSNRIIAGAYEKRWERLLSAWISPAVGLHPGQTDDGHYLGDRS